MIREPDAKEKHNRIYCLRQRLAMLEPRIFINDQIAQQYLVENEWDSSDAFLKITAHLKHTAVHS